MGPADQTKLINFLNAGKSLYIEGDFGYFVKSTPFFAMLGCTHVDGGDSTASVTSFSGLPASIVSGKNYTSLPTTWYWYITRYIDELGSNGAKMIFKCNFNKNRAATYEGKNSTYRVIYSAFVFMQLRGKDAKNGLMKTYMDYLLGTSINKGSDKIQFISNSNDFDLFVHDNRVAFKLSLPARIQADIYTVEGKLVRHVFNDRLNQGSHTFAFNTKEATRLCSGRYIMRFKSPGETVNKVFMVVK